MTREQVAATLLAAGVGLIAYEFTRYRFWKRWSPLAITSALLAFAAVNGLAGYLAALGAEASDWAPAGESAWLLNAMIFAGLGEAVPRTLVRGSGSEAVSGPNTALGQLNAWLEGAFDSLAKSGVERWVVHELDQDRRIEVASYILFKEVAVDPALSSELVKERTADVDRAAGVLRGAISGDVAVARAQLNAFLVREIVERRLVET